MWVYPGIVSAIFFGMYDVSKKHALRQNAVLPVLFLSTVFGAMVMLVAADFLYFKALSYQGSLVAMLATLRCAYIVISLFAGGLLFHEARLSSKTTAVGGILLGVVLILLSK